MFVRHHEIRETREEKAAELQERVDEVLRQGQKDLQEARTKHKKDLAKVGWISFFSKRVTHNRASGDRENSQQHQAREK